MTFIYPLMLGGMVAVGLPVLLHLLIVLLTGSFQIVLSLAQLGVALLDLLA